MLFATRPRLLHSRLLALLVVFGGLASGCQSSRPSFSFQPAPGRARAAMAAKPIVATQDLVAATVAPVAFASSTVVRAQSRTPTELRPHGRLTVVLPVESATITRTAVERPSATHRRVLLHRPQATAEVGLGTTVLGVLGLVVLPIALIGLLLSGGGLVWGILAGAAALAVLVAYLDPFG